MSESVLLQMMFGPSVVAPAFRAMGSIAPLAAEILLAGLERNKALWERMAASEHCSPMSVLTEADGSERVLHVYGGSALEGGLDPDICMYALFMLFCVSRQPSCFCSN